VSDVSLLLIESELLERTRLVRELAAACPALACRVEAVAGVDAAQERWSAGAVEPVDAVLLPATLRRRPLDEALAALAVLYPDAALLVLGVEGDDAAVARALAAGATDALTADELGGGALCRSLRRALALHRAQAKLRASESMLRMFVQHAPAAVAMFDREMRYLMVSDRWRRDYGLQGEVLLGRSHYEVLPETADHWREVMRRCLACAEEQSDEDPFPRAETGIDWIRWEMRPGTRRTVRSAVCSSTPRTSPTASGWRRRCATWRPTTT
jgi:PAS domain S-box-containing protein